MPCPLPTVDSIPDIYHDLISSDVLIDDTACSIHDPQPSCSSSPSFAEPVLSTESASSGEAILHDNFLSHRDTGIRASVFHCSSKHLRKICSLHGLDVSHCSKTRDVRVRLLYHIVNGEQ